MVDRSSGHVVATLPRMTADERGIPVTDTMKHLAGRSSGVQLHLTSLPGGRLGPEARRFVDWLAEAGQRWWQMLPLGPPDAPPVDICLAPGNSGAYSKPLFRSLGARLGSGGLKELVVTTNGTQLAKLADGLYQPRFVLPK